MYMVSTLTDRLKDTDLVDVESTYSAAFAVLELVADDMVGVTLGDGYRVFVGAAILPSGVVRSLFPLGFVQLSS